DARLGRTLRTFNIEERIMGTRMQGKVALITGAARGMGAAFARHFVAEGAKVVLTDILDDQGKTVAADLGNAARYIHQDVADEAGWAQIVKETVATFGTLNVLVNNAGITHRSTHPEGIKIEDETFAGFDRIMKVNLYGTFFGMRAAIKPMREAGGGSIV